MSDSERVGRHLERALEGNLEKEGEKLARQGKLFVRERLRLLLDEESFVEDGLLANALAGDFPADGVVTGVGRGRRTTRLCDRQRSDGESRIVGRAHRREDGAAHRVRAQT